MYQASLSSRLTLLQNSRCQEWVLPCSSGSTQSCQFKYSLFCGQLTHCRKKLNLWVFVLYYGWFFHPVREIRVAALKTHKHKRKDGSAVAVFSKCTVFTVNWHDSKSLVIHYPTVWKSWYLSCGSSADVLSSYLPPHLHLVPTSSSHSLGPHFLNPFKLNVWEGSADAGLPEERSGAWRRVPTHSVIHSFSPEMSELLKHSVSISPMGQYLVHWKNDHEIV